MSGISALPVIPSGVDMVSQENYTSNIGSTFEIIDLRKKQFSNLVKVLDIKDEDTLKKHMPGPRMKINTHHKRARSQSHSPSKSGKSRDEADIKSDELLSPTSGHSRLVLGS